MVKEIIPGQLTERQSEFFKPNKALPWKDWIVDKHLQGMSKIQIHKKLTEEFPEAKDVGIGSVSNIIKKLNPPNKGKKKKVLRGIGANKSEEIRKLAKEMISNNIELNCANIIKTLNNRGIDVSYTHVAMAIGQAVLNNQLKNVQKTILKEDAVCNFDEIVSAKEFVDKLGGLEKAIVAISAYNKLSIRK